MLTGPWSEPRDFVQISSEGSLARRFEAIVWSIEEELGVSAYAVIDGALRKLIVRAFYREPFETVREESMEMDGLELLVGDDTAAVKGFGGGDDSELEFLAAVLSRNAH